MTGNPASRAPIAARILKGFVVTAGAAALLVGSPAGTSKSSELPLAPYQPRTAHQAYGYSLAIDGLRRPSAREWMQAAVRALEAPAAAELPVELTGEFDAERPTAIGVSFAVPGGRRVSIEVETTASAEDGATSGGIHAPFVELFERDGARPVPVDTPPPLEISSPGTRLQRIEAAALGAGDYVLRVQPEIGLAGRYRIRVQTAPLLVFPVEGRTTRAILSGFGAERDGGARAHRGVDIFAPRGTPALAAMDGWVTRVEKTRRGGNVVWLQPLFGDMRLYYAHLDEQLVAPGDFVLAGDVVGTVGNTGNAITTPPHLHFGVYIRRQGMRGGARDPYPFLD